MDGRFRSEQCAGKGGLYIQRTENIGSVLCQFLWESPRRDKLGVDLNQSS